MALGKNAVVSPVLSTLMQGYRIGGTVGHYLFPIVSVDSIVGMIPKFGAEEYRKYRTKRGMRSKSNRMEWGADLIPYELAEHTMEIPVDDREESLGKTLGNNIQPRRIAAKKAQGIVLNDLEIEQAEMAQNPDNYESDHVKSLSSGEKFSNESSDPFAVLETAKEKIRKRIGIAPNTLVLGTSSGSALKRHPKIIDRLKYSQVGVVTDSDLAKVFDLQKVVIGESMMATKEGSFAPLWDMVAVMAYVPEKGDQDVENPSFGYTLSMKNYPYVDEYRDESCKSNIIRSNGLYEIKMTSPVSGFLFTDTI